MKVINLYSGPGVGKSTAAAGLFYHMKSQGISSEIVTEYAKDMVWEARHNILTDQIYVFAKQQRRLARLKGHGLSWVITDSPLPLGLCYLSPDANLDALKDLVWQVFDSYDNHNFVLTRHVPYDPIGRNQTVHEAVVMDQKVRDLLDQKQVPYHVVQGGSECVDQILEILQDVL
jgi:ATP:corrinoid adenosyltransferase